MIEDNFHLGLQTPESPPLKEYFAGLDSGEAENLRGAFAYVSSRGVDQLEEGIPKILEETPSQWLISFDYGYSEPEAVRRLNELGEVRVVAAEPLIERNTLNQATRFHPKLLWVEENGEHNLMVGSSNLTESAWTTNWESAVFLRSLPGNHDQISKLSSWWDEIWEESTPINEELLDWYEGIREASDFGPDEGPEDNSNWEETPDPSMASIVWSHVGYTQGGARNQMDIPTQFGEFFIEEGDEWGENAEHYVSFQYEGEVIPDQKVKFHSGSYQTRIYLPTEVGGKRLADLYSGDKYDKDSLRYYFAVFRRIRPYHFKLRLLPPEDESEIQEIIEASNEQGQVVETEEETRRLVGWL